MSTKETIKTNINNEIFNNTTQQVSPEDIRSNLIDMINSAHLLTEGELIVSANLESPDTRNTRVGDESLSKLALSSYDNSDNTAIGYYVLHSLYDGNYNTGCGSFALGCNVFGDYNNAVGSKALAGNIRGDRNNGYGSLTLYHNTDGDNNIAIGHGAGYYTGINESNKLYIGSHLVDESGVCENPTGSGFFPMIYGDMLNNRMTLNSKTLGNVSSFEVHNVKSQRIQEWYDTSGVVVAYVDNSGTFFSNANDGFQIPSEFGWSDILWNGVLASGDTYLQQIFDKLDNLYPKLDFTHTGFSGVLDTGDDTLQKIFDRVDQNHRPVEMKFILTDETTPLSTTGDIFSFNADFDFLLTSIKTRTKTGTDAEYGITVNGSDILSGVLLSSADYDFLSGVEPGYSILEDDLIQISIESSGTNNTGLKMTFRGATPVNSPYYNGTAGSWNDIY